MPRTPNDHRSAGFVPTIRSGAGRTRILFTGLVAIQVLVVLAVVQADAQNPFSILVVVALLAPLVLLAAILSPQLLLLLTPLLVLIPGTYLGLRVFEWVLLVAMGTTGALSASGGRKCRGPASIEVVWLLYLMGAMISISQAVDVRSAISGFRNLVFSGLAFTAGYRVLGGGHARALFRMMAVLAAAIVVQIIGTILMRGYSFDLLQDRVVALTNLGWGHSNYVAATASLGAACAIALTLFGSARERILGLIAILAALIVQVMTLSRGGAVALVGGLAIAAALEARRRFLPTLAILIALVGVYLLSPLGQASLERFLRPAGLPSVGIRFLYYREAWMIWRSHWILGVGPSQIPLHSAFYTDANPHNIFLKQMADLGAVGLILFLALIALAARRAWRLRAGIRAGRDRMLALGMALVLAVAMVNASYEPTIEGAVYGYLFWLTIGSLCRLADDPPVQESEA